MVDRRKEIDGPSFIGPFYDMILSRFEGPAHFVEVGVFFGRSAAHMATQIKLRQKDIRFDCVDTFEGSPELMNFVNECGGSLLPGFAQNMLEYKLLDRIQVLKMPSQMAASMYQDGSLDFVFIDANHSAASVLADIDAWWPKIKPGGYLGGHDWSHAGVQDAVKARFEPAAMEFSDRHADCWCKRKDG